MVSMFLERIDDLAVATTYTKYTALHLAASHGQEDIVKLLLMHPKVDLQRDHEYGQQHDALELAAQSGFTGIVNLLIEKGATLRIGWWTAFNRAIKNGHLVTTEVLFKAFKDTKCIYQSHATPLYVAIDEEKLGILRMLLEAGAKPGENEIINAAGVGDLVIVQELLGYPVDFSPKGGPERAKTLYCAVSSGRSTVVAEFLKNDTSLASRGSYEETVLHKAATSRRPDILEQFLSLPRYQTIVNSVTNRDLTPLHYAVRSGSLECVQMLISNGANVVHVDEHGETPLHEAARYSDDNVMVVKELQKAHDCSQSGNEDGRQALFFAVENGSFAIVEELFSSYVRSPSEDALFLFAAIKGKYYEVFKLFIEKDGIPGAETARGRHFHTVPPITAL